AWHREVRIVSPDPFAWRASRTPRIGSRRTHLPRCINCWLISFDSCKRRAAGRSLQSADAGHLPALARSLLRPPTGGVERVCRRARRAVVGRQRADQRDARSTRSRRARDRRSARERDARCGDLCITPERRRPHGTDGTVGTTRTIPSVFLLAMLCCRYAPPPVEAERVLTGVTSAPYTGAVRIVMNGSPPGADYDEVAVVSARGTNGNAT